MSIPDLKDKQVLVTGAASGIGRAAAVAFARRGAHIIASDIQLAPLEGVKTEVEALGVSCLIHAVDVSDEAAMKAFAELVHGRVRAVDVLINNAGIAYLGLFLQSDLDHWPRILNVNVMGVVHGCRYFIPKMIEAGGARHVLNVASSTGNYPAPSMPAYAASKYAVAGFTEVLKMELADTQVGLTTVCPGVINTAIVTTGAEPPDPAGCVPEPRVLQGPGDADVGMGQTPRHRQCRKLSAAHRVAARLPRCRARAAKRQSHPLRPAG